MKTVWAAICDDEEIALDLVASSLETCFKQNGMKLVLDKFTSPTDFFQAAQQGKGYQVVFLDIDMPEMNGIDLGVKLRALHESTTIIYISNCVDQVFDSFRARPFGFVRKSSFLKDIQSVVKLYADSMQESNKRRLELKTSQGLMQVPIAEILYIECSKDYQFFHLTKDRPPLKCRLSMAQLEEGLVEDGFLRIHQGYLVNYAFIKRIDNDYVELTNGTKVPMSRRKKQMVFTQYLRLSRNDKSIISTQKD